MASSHALLSAQAAHSATAGDIRNETGSQQIRIKALGMLQWMLAAAVGAERAVEAVVGNQMMQRKHALLKLLP